MLTEQQRLGHMDSTPGSEPGTGAPGISSPGTAEGSPAAAGRYAARQPGAGRAAGKRGSGLPFAIPTAKQGTGEGFSDYYAPHNAGSQVLAQPAYSVYRNADLEEAAEAFPGPTGARSGARRATPGEGERQSIDVLVLKRAGPTENAQSQHYPLHASASAGYDPRARQGKHVLAYPPAAQGLDGAPTDTGPRGSA